MQYRRLSTLQPPSIMQFNTEANVNLTASSTPSPFTRMKSTPFSTGSLQSMSQELSTVTSSGFTTPLQPRESTRFDWSSSRKELETAIAIEQQNESPFASTANNNNNYYIYTAPYDNSIEMQEQRLALRLNKLRLDHHIAVGDGNCQFRSVSFSLFGTQDHHFRVRQKAVRHIQQQRHDFQCFLGEDFDRYCYEMSRPGVWGDELTLRAVCESYGIVINVLTSEAENWFLRYIPSSSQQQQNGFSTTTSSQPKHEIFLTYISPVHYNAVKRRKALQTGKLLRSFSSSSQRQGSAIMNALAEYEKTKQMPMNPQELVQA